MLQWDGTLLGEAMVATAPRLAANGFTATFVGPSNTSMANAITYFDDMIAVSGALDHLEEFSYHRYAGVSIENLQAIADRAVQYDLSTGMLEWWFDYGTYEVLHEDLTIGRNSAWQGSVLAGLFNIDASDPEDPIVTYRTNTKFNRQYFKFVRRGAVRIDAASDGSTFEPIAFINQDGGYVVVAKASTGGDFVVLGLPTGTYGRTYTTSAEYNVDLPEITIGDGETLSATIHQSGVITVYAVDGGCPGTRNGRLRLGRHRAGIADLGDRSVFLAPESGLRLLTPLRRSRLTQHPTGPPFGDTQLLANIIHNLASSRRAQKFG